MTIASSTTINLRSLDFLFFVLLEITNLIKFLSFDDDTSILEDLRLLVEYYAIDTVEELKALKEKNVIVTQGDIDTFKAYIDDCMDDVAFNNTDWNHSLAIALKCMELHKTNER